MHSNVPLPGKAGDVKKKKGKQRGRLMCVQAGKLHVHRNIKDYKWNIKTHEGRGMEAEILKNIYIYIYIYIHTLPFKSLGSPRQFCVFHENSLLFIK